jgi:hypothetical protein
MLCCPEQQANQGQLAGACIKIKASAFATLSAQSLSQRDIWPASAHAQQKQRQWTQMTCTALCVMSMLRSTFVSGSAADNVATRCIPLPACALLTATRYAQRPIAGHAISFFCTQTPSHESGIFWECAMHRGWPGRINDPRFLGRPGLVCGAIGCLASCGVCRCPAFHLERIQPRAVHAGPLKAPRLRLSKAAPMT